MKNFGLSICLFLTATVSLFAQNKPEDFGLPELHIIKTVTLGPSYSCRSHEDFKKGYQNTALFLSTWGKKYNTPDLLFNGACKSEDYLETPDYFSLIADLGPEVALEEVSEARAFNLKGAPCFTAYSKFTQKVEIKVNNTYAVLLNGVARRGLFVFKVTEYVPNERITFRYAVKRYQIIKDGGVYSEGSNPEKTNYSAQP